MEVILALTIGLFVIFILDVVGEDIPLDKKNLKKKEDEDKDLDFDVD